MTAGEFLPGEEQARETRRRFLDMKVPPRYRDAKITEPVVTEWVQEYLAGQRQSLYICGPVGTGKTYLAWAALMAVLALAPIPPERTSGWQVVDWLDACRPGGDPDAYDDTKRAGLLLLDDVGAHKGTDWTNERLYALIDIRYINMRPTIYTSNLSAQEITAVLGERVASRLAEDALIVPLLGADRRRTTQ
jgi:DNA replication protein DnaC